MLPSNERGHKNNHPGDVRLLSSGGYSFIEKERICKNSINPIIMSLYGSELYL